MVIELICIVFLNIRQEILEQERRDRELALRLASEDQSEVEDVVVPPLQRYELLLLEKSHNKHKSTLETVVYR